MINLGCTITIQQCDEANLAENQQKTNQQKTNKQTNKGNKKQEKTIYIHNGWKGGKPSRDK